MIKNMMLKKRPLTSILKLEPHRCLIYGFNTDIRKVNNSYQNEYMYYTYLKIVAYIQSYFTLVWQIWLWSTWGQNSVTYLICYLFIINPMHLLLHYSLKERGFFYISRYLPTYTPIRYICIYRFSCFRIEFKEHYKFVYWFYLCSRQQIVSVHTNMVWEASSLNNFTCLIHTWNAEKKKPIR